MQSSILVSPERKGSHDGLLLVATDWLSSIATGSMVTGSTVQEKKMLKKDENRILLKMSLLNVFIVNKKLTSFFVQIKTLLVSAFPEFSENDSIKKGEIIF